MGSGERKLRDNGDMYVLATGETEFESDTNKELEIIRRFIKTQERAEENALVVRMTGGDWNREIRTMFVAYPVGADIDITNQFEFYNDNVRTFLTLADLELYVDAWIQAFCAVSDAFETSVDQFKQQVENQEMMRTIKNNGDSNYSSDENMASPA